MASYLKALNPIPGFPEYTGPHKVGTIDVELPVSELDSQSGAPQGAVETVQYRIFYPCEDEAKPSQPINWLPNPQRAHVAAYTKFLGAGSTLAEFVSFFPRLLYYITIPVRKNAPLLQPTTPSKRWPVMIFSHGLAGSRNAYSHLVGSIASHGVIVIAPEHRDASTPVSFVRGVSSNNDSSEKNISGRKARRIDYRKISHTPSPEVEAARTAQLKIRSWELGCIHDSLLKMDKDPLSLNNLNTSSASLEAFGSKMEVHTPGSITFAGHSFGAATVAQFIKSVYYSPVAHEAPSSYEAVFSPDSRSPILKQITPNTPLVLLDLWCFPLRAQSTSWLWNKPMPCYDSEGPGGSAILAVESQAFVKWRVHLKATKRLLSHDPSSASAKPEDDSRPPPHFYYPSTSAHLSQSDFGILFPWVTKKIFAIEEPERVMKLNVRAILQLMRERHIPVSPTSKEDMEIGSEIADGEVIKDDKKIFCRGDEIRGWNYLTTDAADLHDVDFEEESAVKDEKASPAQAVVGGEVLKGNDGQNREGIDLAETPETASA